jgi:putative FmdB family regulatory protein
MPIYAYRCTECGHELDVLQKISEAPLTDCPACHRPTLTKKLTAAGFQLKGSGWYVTDFRDKAAKKEAKADAAGSNEAKADAKPATEAPPKPAESASAPSSPAPAPSPTPTPPPSSDS